MARAPRAAEGGLERVRQESAGGRKGSRPPAPEHGRLGMQMKVLWCATEGADREMRHAWVVRGPLAQIGMRRWIVVFYCRGSVLRHNTVWLLWERWVRRRASRVLHHGMVAMGRPVSRVRVNGCGSCGCRPEGPCEDHAACGADLWICARSSWICMCACVLCRGPRP